MTDRPPTLADLLGEMTPKGESPANCPDLADWVNHGGCPAALDEASRRMTSLLRCSPGEVAIPSTRSATQDWVDLMPSEFAEVLGITDDGCFIMGTGPREKGNAPPEFRLEFTTVAEAWLSTREDHRDKFPLNPIIDAWYVYVSDTAKPVSARHLVAPVVMKGAPGKVDIPLARASSLLALANTPLTVVEVDGVPVASGTVAPRTWYRAARRPEQGELWPAPRTIAGTDACCAVLSALSGYRLHSDERCPLRSDVYRICLLGQALSGRTTIPEHTGVRWLTGGSVNDAGRRRFWDAMSVADSLRITVNSSTHEWRRLVIADPYDGGVHLSPPEWQLARGQGTGGFRLTGALWRPAVLDPRSGRGCRGGGVWGGLHRTLAGIEAALSYGPTGGRNRGARIPINLRPVRHGGPGPDQFIPWHVLLSLAGECVPFGADGKSTASRRYRRRVEDLLAMGYLTSGDHEATAGDTVEVVGRVPGRGQGAVAGIWVRATARFVEAYARAQNSRNWSLIPASSLLEPAGRG